MTGFGGAELAVKDDTRRKRARRPVAARALALAVVLACALPGAAGARIERAGEGARSEDGGVASRASAFSDGSRPPTRRVFTYRGEYGVPVFTDQRPSNVHYQVMEFTCFACDPSSRVNWRATALHRNKYNAEIADAAATYGVDAALIRAVMHAESGFNPYARSRAGAVGLMQLMPGTARELGVGDITSVRENIVGGVKYLKRLLEQYKGDVTLALAAYNAGPNSVDRHGGVPPIAETRTYVERVKILHQRYRSAG